MSNANRLIVIAALVCAVAVVLVLKQHKPETGEEPGPAQGTTTPSPAVAAAEQNPGSSEALPRLVDLGAGKCIPCKMMAPILDELKKDYAGTFDVEFIDVWEDPEAGEQYGIRMIPTQIFYDAAGEELFRHEGFLAKEDILDQWKTFGVDVVAKEGP